MMNLNISNILELDEKIIWSGKPDVKSLLFFGLLYSIVLFSFATVLYIYSSLGDNAFQTFFTILIILLFIIPTIMFYIYKNTDYIVTNNRLIIKTGFISVKTRSIYYDEIKSTFADKGLIDKVFGTGTILINANRIIKHDKKNILERLMVDFALLILKPI